MALLCAVLMCGQTALRAQCLPDAPAAAGAADTSAGGTGTGTTGALGPAGGATSGLTVEDTGRQVTLVPVPGALLPPVSTLVPGATGGVTGPPSAWRDLFTSTWGDTRRLPSTDTFTWLVAGTIAAGTVHPADGHWGRSISSVTSLREPLEPGAVLGSTPLQMGLSLLTYGVGRARQSPRAITVGSDLFRAQLLAQGLTTGMKISIRRQRPEGGGFAFPSGHTTVSFASATVLQRHFGWRAGLPAYALASYVALSRVQMQRHFVSDVAFGAALGIAVGRTVTIGRTRQLHVMPMAAEGGGGVQFMLTRRVN